MRLLIKHFQVVLLISIIFFVIQRLHLSIFKLFAFNDIIYSVYLPAGARLLAIILFGPLGAIGIFFGWLWVGLVTPERGVFESLFIGASSALSAYLAYFLWLKIFHLSSILQDLSGQILLYLVLMVAIVTAPFRMFYLYFFGWPVSPTILIVSFIGDLLGCLLVILGLKAGYYLYRTYYLPMTQK